LAFATSTNPPQIPPVKNKLYPNLPHHNEKSPQYEVHNNYETYTVFYFRRAVLREWSFHGVVKGKEGD
jgi:hypothetical protein